jgi:hypothetical protein
MTCRPPEHNASLTDWWIKAKQTIPKPLRTVFASIALDSMDDLETTQ